MVEDPQFWEDNNVGLAVSANAGPIGDDRGPWFKYPAGCLAMNVPITSTSVNRLDCTRGSLKRPVWREMSSRRTGFHRISVSVDSKGLRLVVVVFRCDLAAASHCRQNTANHYKTKRKKPLLCKTSIDLYDSAPWRPPNRISL